MVARDLIELITRIVNYIFRDSAKAKKGIGDIMGEKVLELESDRLIKQGELRGEMRGELKGAAKNARETVLRMLKVGKYPLDEISLISGLEPEQIEKLKAEENL